MKLEPTSKKPTLIEADAVVIGVYADTPLKGKGYAAAVDKATGGVLSQLIESEEISTKKYDLTPLLALPGIKASHVVVVGMGPKEELDRQRAFRCASAAARHLAAKERAKVAFYLAEDWSEDLVESGICGVLVGCHGQDLYRAEKNRHPFNEALWGSREKTLPDGGAILGESVNLTRRLVNEPPHEVYPESFAQTSTWIAEEYGMDIEVWDLQRLEAGRCGALLAVARGSDRPPRLVILRHRGGDDEGPTLALVGKGVTFDSGGLSLKSVENMKSMKGDMAGAATVLGAMQAIARLKIPANVIGLFGLVENMPGGNSYKLGDVLTARNGKTIEVHNTDAEGRLVLADVLSVAVDQKAAKIVDVATLTGACVVALGNDVAGLMTNDQPWCDMVAEAARTCGEAVWQLPMFEEYAKHIKSEVADIKNVGDGRWGGAITAAKFLEEFVGDVPWTHIDIAGPSFLEKPKPWLDGGSSGAFVRTLVEAARAWTAAKK